MFNPARRPTRCRTIRRLTSGVVSPTTREIVEELEAMAPDVRALLDSLGAGYGSRDK
jgi:hypothetical protein